MHAPRLLILVLCVLAVAAGAPPTAEADALDFTATALDGSPFSGRSLAGRAVLLDFWGSWCAPCIHAFPTLRRLHEEFSGDLRIVGMAYYSGELSDIAAAAAEHDLRYTVVEGNEAALDKFEVFAFPTYVLISAEGDVVFAQAGEVLDLYERVVQAMRPATD